MTYGEFIDSCRMAARYTLPTREFQLLVDRLLACSGQFDMSQESGVYITACTKLVRKQTGLAPAITQMVNH